MDNQAGNTPAAENQGSSKRCGNPATAGNRHPDRTTSGNLRLCSPHNRCLLKTRRSSNLAYDN
jgi:hypothetical protein